MVLSLERGLATVDPQIPRMLDCRELVVVLPLRPRHTRAGIHHRLVGGVEGVSSCGALSSALALTPHLGILSPQLISGRPLVDQLRPLALPRRMPHPVEQTVGQVVRTNHRDGGNPCDFLARPSEPEDRTREDAFTGCHLRRAPAALIRLRIIYEAKVRSYRASIGPRVTDATDATRDASDTHGCTSRGSTIEPGQRHLVGSPSHVSRLALARLATNASRDAVQRTHWEARRWEVLGEQVVLL